MVSYLRDSFFIVHVVGKQQARKSAMMFSRGKSTREMLKNDRDIMVKTKTLMYGFSLNGRVNVFVIFIDITPCIANLFAGGTALV